MSVITNFLFKPASSLIDLHYRRMYLGLSIPTTVNSVFSLMSVYMYYWMVMMLWPVAWFRIIFTLEYSEKVKWAAPNMAKNLSAGSRLVRMFIVCYYKSWFLSLNIFCGWSILIMIINLFYCESYSSSWDE